MAFVAVSVHQFVIEVDFVSNRLEVFFVKVTSVTEALDRCLETPELHTVQFD